MVVEGRRIRDGPKAFQTTVSITVSMVPSSDVSFPLSLLQDSALL